MQTSNLSADSLESFTYHAPPLIKRLVGRPALPAMTASYARLCLPWLAAVMLRKGSIGLADFTPESLADPALRILADRIKIVDNGNPNPSSFIPAVAVARCSDGRELRRDVTTQFGAPDWPLSVTDHMAKALHCLEFGGMGRIHAGLADLMDRFDRLDDVTPVFRLTAGH
jgi:2-methylcitrate dehydratase PrpD